MVTITNTTNPDMIITPGAYAVHDTAGQFWTSGEMASLALERIAEVGEPGEAIASLGAVAIDPAPANGDSVTFEIMATPGQLFSSAQMLIATNDAFVGVDSEPLFEGDTPRTITLDLMAYDAGTEENAGLFSGFDGGQPDPDRGEENLDGTATAEAIAPHAQFTGAQATITIVPALPAADDGTDTGDMADDGDAAAEGDAAGDGDVIAPPASGNAGFAGTAGDSTAQLVIALALALAVLGVGARVRSALR